MIDVSDRTAVAVCDYRPCCWRTLTASRAAARAALARHEALNHPGQHSSREAERHAARRRNGAGTNETRRTLTT